MIRIRFVSHSDGTELGTAELVGGRLVADRPSVQAVIDGKVLGLDLSGPQAAEYFASWSNGYIGSEIVTGPGDHGHEALTARPTTTAGIDLAASPVGTAIVVVDWTATTAVTRLVSDPVERSDDADTILATLARDDRIGIDCPFGWPEEFVDAIAGHRGGGAWPTGPDVDDRRSLRLRATDRHLEDGYDIHPLSVSSDKIGSVAMRWASLLTRHERAHGPVDRTGGGRVVEVYPALAFGIWQLATDVPKVAEYKKKDADGVEARALLLDLLERRITQLSVDHGTRSAAAHVTRGHDVVDALLAGLVAAAAATPGCVEETLGTDSGIVQQARTEGWIVVPTRGSLSQLAPRRGPWFLPGEAHVRPRSDMPS